MKFDKKVMESGVVVAFTMVLAFTAVPAAGVSTEAGKDSRTVELAAETTERDLENVIATKIRRHNEIVASSVEEVQPEDSKQEKAVEKKENKSEEQKLNNEDEKQSEEPQSEEQKLNNGEEKQSEEPQSDNKEAEVKAEDQQPENKEEKQQTKDKQDKQSENKEAEGKAEEVSPWEDKLMPDVEEYLNVRTEASEDAEPAGKLPKGAAAEIVERGEEWTKISSGSVEGYVKNEFCVTGVEAETLANEVGTTYATATTGGVRVRETASAEEDVTILDVLEEGGKIKVDTEAEAIEGWVCVKVNDKAGYVSADYVDVELELGKAISVEEERAAIEAAEAERKAKEAAQAKQSQGSSTQQKAPAAASYDDVTLLGALIQCEAGSECYEGQVAVGAVVMNRVRAGYAGSISGVIYQSGQFTPASNGMLAGVLAGGVSGSCIQAAQEAINGVDNVGGATSFRSTSSGMPGLVIGNHVFF